MKRTQFKDAPCSIARSLDVMGDWWTPLIVRECLFGMRRFGDMERWLPISRNILAARLKQLVAQGILDKRQYSERPPRYEYHLTERGMDVAKIALAHVEFGERWMFEPGQEPIHIFDRRTGERVIPILVDQTTGKPLDPRHVYAGPGPSFPAAPNVRQDRFREFYETQAPQEPTDSER